MKRLLSLTISFAAIFVGGFVAVLLVSPALTYGHIYLGGYSYLLDGVIQGNPGHAIFGYFFICFFNGLFVSLLFFVVFLVFWFVDRGKTKLNHFIVSLLSFLFSAISFIMFDLNGNSPTGPPTTFNASRAFYNSLIICGAPILFNFIAFRLGKPSPTNSSEIAEKRVLES